MVLFRGPLALALAVLLVVASAALDGNIREVLVCSKNTQDPTFLDILKSMISPDVGLYALKLTDSLAPFDVPLGGTTVVKVLRGSLDMTFPLKSFVSVGFFTLSYKKANHAYSFNDILVLSPKGFLLSKFCSYTSSLGYYSSVCDCGSDIMGPDAIFEGLSADSFCARKSPCTDKSVSQEYCEVLVNPFSESCLLVSVKTDVPDKVVSSSVQYKLFTPTLYTLFAAVFGGEQYSLTAQRHPELDPRTSEPLSIKNLPFIPAEAWSAFLKALSYIPQYFVALCLGLFFALNSCELADSLTAQVAMECVYGVFLAVIVMAYLLHSQSRRVLGRYGGTMGELANIPLSLSMVSMVLANPKILSLFFYALVAFWHSGYPFGVWWLGKAYFLGSVASCIAICRYFDLFQPDTKSWYIMYYSIKIAGLVLLSQSSSSSTLAVLLVLYGVFAEELHHYMWITYMVCNVAIKSPTYKFLGRRKLTAVEVGVISKNHTDKSLRELRAYMQQNGQEMDLLLDKFHESGEKDTQSKLMSRFVGGSYPGVPYTVEAEGGEQVGWTWRSFLFVVVVFLVCFLVTSFGYNHLLVNREL
ncbi:hypothetical protein B484DRAFT_404935 [Ochromonadaceae sp. CCMP2298]|nr:hypothetical protein B484DRAFT_404935 [Ochromonadaceae sp. CCMP2298]